MMELQNMPMREEDVPDELALGSADLVTFTLHELRTYTQEFGNIIGAGGFGTVYEGMISGRNDDLNGKRIAVKASKGIAGEFRNEWEAEIRYLSTLNHPNIIKLIGKCATTMRLFLVYPFVNKGSVHSKLSGLNWRRSLGIMRGAARALQHLHSQSPPLIFRDFKSENILLDENWNPIVCDFGTVRPEGEVGFAGTIGYTEPIVLLSGVGTKETDIFSLGVLILQLIMKSRVVVNPNDERDVSQGTTIRFWASERYQNKGNAVHRSLKKKGCKKEDAAAITKLGLDCTGPNSGARPTVEQVLETLSGLDDGRHTNPYNLTLLGDSSFVLELLKGQQGDCRRRRCHEVWNTALYASRGACTWSRIGGFFKKLRRQ